MDILTSAKHKRKRKIKTKNEVEFKKLKSDSKEKERLEKAVIGDCSSIVRNIARLLDNDSGLEDDSDGVDSESQFSDTLASPPRQPAWEDDDEDLKMSCKGVFKMQGLHQPSTGILSENYQQSLRKKFKSVFGEPVWAKLDKHKSLSSDDEDDVAVLRSCGNLIKKSGDLPKNLLDAKLVASLNSQTRTEGPYIKAVEFHPTSAVSLVAGVSGVASIFQVDGLLNSKLSSVHFDRFPIRCAKFTRDGNKFIVGSNLHSHFYVYDMMEGKSMKVPVHHNMEQTNMKSFEVSPDGKLIAVRGRFGAIHLLTTSSFEWVGNLQMNGEVTALSFNSTGSTLYSHGESGEVYNWDMNSRTCVSKFWDEGCLSGSCLAVSADDNLLAAGSSSGVVNIYSSSSLSSPNPTPVKTLLNLTTPSTFVKFDSSSQILAFGSDEKINAIKLCHVPSMTVFSNFPLFNHELSRVQCAAFSPNSGYLSIANNKSTAFLYRLKHFGNY